MQHEPPTPCTVVEAQTAEDVVPNGPKLVDVFRVRIFLRKNRADDACCRREMTTCEMAKRID